MEHRVVTHHLVHLQRLHLAASSDFFNQLEGDMAEFVLSVQQHRHHRRARAARRIYFQQLRESGFHFRRKSHQRSTSPNTKSMLPSDAMESASSRPSSSGASACRFPKLGVLIKMRYGLDVPLLTT